jgi:hypothetical protein
MTEETEQLYSLAYDPSGTSTELWYDILTQYCGKCMRYTNCRYYKIFICCSSGDDFHNCWNNDSTLDW